MLSTGPAAGRSGHSVTTGLRTTGR
jgi:hypothetical protein